MEYYIDNIEYEDMAGLLTLIEIADELGRQSVVVDYISPRHQLRLERLGYKLNLIDNTTNIKISWE